MSGKRATHPEASPAQRDFILKIGGDPLWPENAKQADQYIRRLIGDIYREGKKGPSWHLLQSVEDERPKRYKRPKSKATSRKGVKLSPKAAKREREWREWSEQ